MASFKIFTAGQMIQVLKRSEGDRFNSLHNKQVATMRNTVHGWIAKKDDDADGEGVNVSRLINQHDGAAQIADLLGL